MRCQFELQGRKTGERCQLPAVDGQPFCEPHLRKRKDVPWDPTAKVPQSSIYARPDPKRKKREELEELADEILEDES